MDDVFEFMNVSTLYAGMTFGEVALQQLVPRTARIKSKTDSYLAVIKKADYDRALKKPHQEFVEKLLLQL